jgi:hypothetical protein
MTAHGAIVHGNGPNRVSGKPAFYNDDVFRNRFMKQ